MLGKLLKYEFKATGRKFLPLYAAILFASLLLNIGIRFPFLDIMIAMAGLLLFGLVIALVVISLMTIIQRFKNNLLQDEGYLMFTLPVSTEELIFSKLITAVVWVIVSFIVGTLAGLLIAVNREFISAIQEAIDYLPELVGYIKSEYVVWLILGVICMLLQLIYFILLIYTSLSVSQMAVFNKRRGLVSLIAFIIINIVVNTITGYIFKGLDYYNLPDNFTMILSTAIVVNALLCAGMFTATDYLLKRHLNIE